MFIWKRMAENDDTRRQNNFTCYAFVASLLLLAGGTLAARYFASDSTPAPPPHGSPPTLPPSPLPPPPGVEFSLASASSSICTINNCTIGECILQTLIVWSLKLTKSPSSCVLHYGAPDNGTAIECPAEVAQFENLYGVDITDLYTSSSFEFRIRNCSAA